jgi:hypothetical protein
MYQSSLDNRLIPESWMLLKSYQNRREYIVAKWTITPKKASQLNTK